MKRFVALAVGVVAATAVAQGRVTAAGALSTARVNHTATRLADGRALVVGGKGTDGLTALASAELFTPKTSKWSAAAPLARGRSHHTATLLADGRVLVAGGTAADEAGDSARFIPLASAEVYDPKTNTWAAVPPMREARNGHAAVLLPDGRVLVVGGMRERKNLLRAAEAFDPKTSTWTTMPPLRAARWMHAAAVLPDGEVVVLGGRGASGAALVETERFVHGEWVAGPPLNEARARVPVVVRGSDVVAIGGQSTTMGTNYVEALRPGAAAWTLEEASLTTALMDHSATALSTGEVVVVGGEPPASVDVARVLRWTGTSKTWCLAGTLGVSRKGHVATLLPGDAVLITGGLSGGVVEASAELWKPTAGKCEAPQ